MKQPAKEQKPAYAIELRGVSARRSDAPSLHSVDLHLPAGAVYLLIGPKDAGKRELLKYIIGPEAPDAGEIYFFGKSSAKAKQAARERLGFFLGGGFYPYLSAYQNLHYLALMKGIVRPGKEARRVLRLCAFEGADRRCSNLPEAEIKQLGLAAALLGRPEILILDEALSMLDLASVEKIRAALQELNRSESLSILLTRNLYTQIGLKFTHIGLIDRGRMVFEMSAESLRKACRSEIIFKTARNPLAVWVLEEKLNIHDYTIDGQQRIHVPAQDMRPEIIGGAMQDAGIRIDLLYESEMNIHDFCRQFLESRKQHA